MSPEFEVTVADDAGAQWSGWIQLSPPRLKGRLRREPDGPEYPVTGEIRAERGGPGLPVLGALPGVNGLVGMVPQLFKDVAAEVTKDLPGRGRWAGVRLRGSLDPGTDVEAELVFDGDRWRAAPGPLRVVRLDQGLLPWLRRFLDEAARTLDAHLRTPASLITTWEIAWLHLLFQEIEPAHEATMRSVAVLETNPGPLAEDTASARRLVKDLDALGLEEAAAALQTALGG